MITLTVSLNRTGKQLLKKYHELKAKLLVTVAGKTVATWPITLHAPAKHKRR